VRKAVTINRPRCCRLDRGFLELISECYFPGKAGWSECLKWQCYGRISDEALAVIAVGLRCSVSAIRRNSLNCQQVDLGGARLLNLNAHSRRVRHVAGGCAQFQGERFD